jgi:DNA-binding winged helix-turn-helix (wHTH) protein
MSQQTKRFYEFDLFRIDLSERALLCEGEFVPLTQKAFEGLMPLVEMRGGLVSKEELMSKVWPRHDCRGEYSHAKHLYAKKSVGPDA